jgi:hypothetical protein
MMLNSSGMWVPPLMRMPSGVRSMVWLMTGDSAEPRVVVRLPGGPFRRMTRTESFPEKELAL